MKKITFELSVASVAALSMLSGIVHAGFVDARAGAYGDASVRSMPVAPPAAINGVPFVPYVQPPPPPPVPSPVVEAPAFEKGRVAGDLGGSKWKGKLAKSSSNGHTIREAIKKLVPSAFVKRGIDIDEDVNQSKRYTWGAKESRLGALRNVAYEGGLYINVSSDGVLVQRHNPVTKPAAAAVAPSQTAVAPQAMISPSSATTAYASNAMPSTSSGGYTLVYSPPMPVSPFGAPVQSGPTPVLINGPLPNADAQIRSRDSVGDVFNASQPIVREQYRAAMVANSAFPVMGMVDANGRTYAQPVLGAPDLRANPAALPLDAPMPISSTGQGGSKPLVVTTGQTLAPALKNWLAAQGFDLVWTPMVAPGQLRDVQFVRDFSSTGSDLTTVLREALSPYGFEAQVFAGAPPRVIVRDSVVGRR